MSEKRTSPNCASKEQKGIALYIAFIPLLVAIIALALALPSIILASWWTSLDVASFSGTWVPFIELAVAIVGIIWFLLALMVRYRKEC